MSGIGRIEVNQGSTTYTITTDPKSSDRTKQREKIYRWSEMIVMKLYQLQVNVNKCINDENIRRKKSKVRTEVNKD